MKMTYDEARQYIKEASKAGIRPGLSCMRELCRRLGNPQDDLKIIHIAGTNGKGSTAAYLSSIFGVNGYLTGRYVSPTVFCYEECIQYEDMDGVHYIDKDLLTELIGEVAEAAEAMVKDGWQHPTTFELETAVSFLAFCRWQCRVVILEAGMGGREDATNVVSHVLASVITPIGLDHMAWLGDTIAEIAGEKAGIIKEKGKVISFQTEPAARAVITSVCRKKQAELTEVSEEDMSLLSMDENGCVFSYCGENYRTGMTGIYQMQNASLAIGVCRSLKEEFPLEPERIMVGVKEAYWRGRLERVCTDPLIYVDGAHNESGARALADSLKELLKGRKIHGVMGVFRDKEYEKIVSIMSPLLTDIVAVPAPGTRGLPAADLKAVWEREKDVPAESADSVEKGLKKAIIKCESGDAIVMFGSLSLLGELRWKNKQ